MIKVAVKTEKGDDLYILGLSKMNMEKLQQDMPIMFNLSELGLPAGTCVIMYGETETDIKQELESFIGPVGTA